MKNLAFICLVAASMGSFAVGCASAPEPRTRELVVVGSDTMVELNRRLAEAFMRAHPGDTVRVEGGGSGIGIEALVAGRAEIAACSRPLASAEVAALYERFETLGVRFLVAQDALSVYVNQANPVRDLGLEQLRGIFSGSITDWAEVGGTNGEIVVVVRPPSSGTHRFFRDHVLLGAPYSARALSIPTTRGILSAVHDEPRAIGYGGLAYRRQGVVQISVAGVGPTRDNVRANAYPLARYLSYYTAKPPHNLAQRFIDWSLGPQGQRVVAEVGYIPLWERR